MSAFHSKLTLAARLDWSCDGSPLAASVARMRFLERKGRNAMSPQTSKPRQPKLPGFHASFLFRVAKHKEDIAVSRWSSTPIHF